MNRTLLGLVGGGLALVLLGACARTTGKDLVPDVGRDYPPAYGDTLVQGTIADPAILNPVLASDSASFEVIGLVFSSLLRYDKDLNLTGELAERWEISLDGKEITFFLRHNAKWHDGYPVTAKDVVFTLKTYLDPNVRTAYRSNYTNIASYSASDAYTFQVTYQEPFAPALESLAALSILPEHLLKNRDVNTADDFNNAPIGSGPYKFVNWKRADSIRLEANPEYFEGRPYLNRVFFRIIPDTAVQFLELKKGGLDMMGLTPDQFNKAGNQNQFLDRFSKYRYPSNQYTYLGFNLKHPLFKVKKFREGVAQAINRQALVETVLEGLGRVGTGPYTERSWAFNPEVKPVPFDPLRARELFVAAGCRYLPNGMLSFQGKPVEFTLLTNQGNRTREQTATIIQSQLKDVGIQVNIRIIAWSTFISEFLYKRKFDAVIMGWSLAQDPDLYDIWHSSKTREQEFNFVGYNNPEVDQLLVQGRRTFNQERRQRIYRSVHRLIAADLPYVFLYAPDSLPVVHRRVLGIVPGPAGISYNFIRWFVPKAFQRYQ